MQFILLSLKKFVHLSSLQTIFIIMSIYMYVLMEEIKSISLKRIGK